MKQYISLANFLLILALGFMASIFALLQTILPQQSILNGSFTKSLEPEITKSLFFYDHLVSLYGSINYILFNEGTPGVLIGRYGWLFTSEEWQHDRQTQTNFDDNIRFIREANVALKNLGITLILVPIPLKSEIYKDYTGLTLPPPIKEKRRDFYKFLDDNAIPYCNLNSSFMAEHKMRPLFFKTDTHWTPEGAFLAAREVSKYIKQQPWKMTPYVREHGEISLHNGDLLSYLPIYNMQNFRDETFQSYIYKNTEEKNNAEILFGESVYDIALIGTSYSANPKWEFQNALQYTLSASILNFADEGHGPFANMALYLDYLKNEERHPNLVIWEIPERYLLLPSLGKRKEK